MASSSVRHQQAKLISAFDELDPLPPAEALGCQALLDPPLQFLRTDCLQGLTSSVHLLSSLTSPFSLLPSVPETFRPQATLITLHLPGHGYVDHRSRAFLPAGIGGGRRPRRGGRDGFHPGGASRPMGKRQGISFLTGCRGWVESGRGAGKQPCSVRIHGSADAGWRAAPEVGRPLVSWLLSRTGPIRGQDHELLAPHHSLGSTSRACLPKRNRAAFSPQGKPTESFGFPYQSWLTVP